MSSSFIHILSRGVLESGVADPICMFSRQQVRGRTHNTTVSSGSGLLCDRVVANYRIRLSALERSGRISLQPPGRSRPDMQLRHAALGAG